MWHRPTGCWLYWADWGPNCPNQLGSRPRSLSSWEADVKSVAIRELWPQGLKPQQVLWLRTLVGTWGAQRVKNAPQGAGAKPVPRPTQGQSIRRP